MGGLLNLRPDGGCVPCLCGQAEGLGPAPCSARTMQWDAYNECVGPCQLQVSVTEPVWLSHDAGTPRLSVQLEI